MKKSILFRVLGLGAIPRKLRPLLDAEEIVLADEGMRGWFLTGNVNGPGRRYRHRAEGLSGCLVITKKRILCYSFGKRQINISVDDPKISEFHVDLPRENTLSISFESSAFREGWQGKIELRFRTEKAREFRDALRSLGAQGGSIADP